MASAQDILTTPHNTSLGMQCCIEFKAITKLKRLHCPNIPHVG